MNPAQIIQVIEAKCRLLSQKNDEYPDLVEQSALAERDYKTTFAKTVLKLKLEGHPATLIPTLAAGDKTVAQLKFSWDVKVAICKANLESTKSTVTQIDAARSLLTWLREEKGKG